MVPPSLRNSGPALQKGNISNVSGPPSERPTAIATACLAIFDGNTGYSAFVLFHFNSGVIIVDEATVAAKK
jgi:hypothetical protein